MPQLRDVMTRFSMPFGFYAIESEQRPAICSHEAGLDATRLPVVIRYDGQVDGRIRACPISPAPSA